MKLSSNLKVLVCLGSIVLAGCASNNDNKLVNVDGIEATPYCAKRLEVVIQQNNNFKEGFNLYSDKLSVEPWISRDYADTNKEFYNFTQSSLKPFLHANLGVPYAMTNNEVCGTIFNYVDSEQALYSKFLNKANEIFGDLNEDYKDRVESSVASNMTVTYNINQYKKFKAEMKKLIDKTKTESKENRTLYIDYVNSQSK